MKQVALLLALFFGGASLCSAGLFSDDEAHQRITILQQQIQSFETRITQMETTARTQGVGLLTQIDVLKAELANLRGQVEVHTHNIETTQKRQRDLYVDLDSRLRRLEGSGSAPAESVQNQNGAGKSDGSTPAAMPGPDESKVYESAQNLLKAGNYAGAIIGFQNFIKEFPGSARVSNAQYWIGDSYFNQRDYKNAIASQQKLVSQYPTSPKVPDALLNIASCQQGLGDAAGAKKTLESVIVKFPLSDAAVRAKKRLTGAL